ncbi:3-deoxy-D-manno-octulosonic acid kinase [Hydrogenophaga sp. A37]|uniref:3-deoxy-D-manno-octulosonic acid kinase n=1 Tax=Hydrogenophaga sp. A37 TaxID=1945864 RepID=UPI0009D4F74E|nr:3-deoxy-D-manno-octulosonic acid kinase [Hydrogenophaga sp. A37]OOG79126.1 3-deoxy-D-manno-octulosonic acid kinase [Hydrogenophaga sp. A37]
MAHRSYRLLMRALTLPVLSWLWLRGHKDAGYRERLGERLGFIDPTPASAGGLWIHAASVGEVQAARPLIAALRTEWPDHTITVSTQSPNGARTLRAHWGDAIQHVYAPIDTPGAAGRFLDRLQPSMLVLIEREIWPEWLCQCRQRLIPVALVNARLSADSAASYERWRALMRPVWAQLAVVAAADAPSEERYATLGVPRKHLLHTGNLKFDQRDTQEDAHSLPWLERRAVVVAGSTHEGEESALIASWHELARQIPGALLILVPRHPERFDAVAQELEEGGLSYVRRSRGETPIDSTSVLLADTMGELTLWYLHASVCFIGGSLVPIGGHNALEAMTCAKPVLFGPHTHHFQELYQDVEASGAGERIDSARLLMHTAAQWMRDKTLLQRKGQQARDFVLRQQGSSQRTLETLRQVWAPMHPPLLSPVSAQEAGAQTLWHDPQRITVCDAALFEAPSTNGSTLATGSGRGQAHRISLDLGEGVLRHYRRGGLMARLSPDRYLGRQARDSRAMAEFTLLRRMHAWGLPVPAPVAARQRRAGWGYTADIVVAMIPQTRNVAQCLSDAPLPDAAWRALGTAIRRLHDRQVFHADLNCHNLLINATGEAWIVDFDKCALRAGEAWKAQNLDRLLRSLRKEKERRNPFHWDESGWGALLLAYSGSGSAPAPRD